jgi:hypothetical protein
MRMVLFTCAPMLAELPVSGTSAPIVTVFGCVVSVWTFEVHPAVDAATTISATIPNKTILRMFDTLVD